MHFLFTVCALIFYLSLGANAASPPTYDPDVYFDGLDELEGVSSAPALFRDDATDAGFATGQVITSIGTTADAARGGFVRSDGGIVVVGRTVNAAGDPDFAIVRYHPSGALDSAFNSSGKVSLNFGSGSELAHAAVEQTDGKFLVAGRSDEGFATFFDFALARLETNGTLDTTFSTDGKVTLDVLGSASIARSVALDSNTARIVLGGYAWDGIVWKSVVVRYTTDGELDTAFNTTGKVVTPTTVSDNSYNSVITLPDSGIIAVGTCYNVDNFEVCASRYSSNGQLDTSFYTVGRIMRSFGSGNDRGFSVALSSGGSFAIAGTATPAGNSDFLIASYLTDGTLDTSFATRGFTTFDFQSGNDEALSLLLTTNPKYILGGYLNNGSNTDMAILRLNSNGSLDTSFGTLGRIATSLGTGHDVAQALLANGDDSFFAAGRTVQGSVLSIGIVRWTYFGSVAKSGDLDRFFATVGFKSYNISGTDSAKAIAFQTDGQVILNGSTATNFFFMRLSPDGSVDTTFATTGTGQLHVSGNDGGYGVGVATDGKFILVGQDQTSNYVIARYKTDGALDTTFKTTGVYTFDVSGAGPDVATRILFNSDGTIIVTGAANYNMGLVRLFTDGNLDTSFSSDGKATFDDFGGIETSQGMVLQTDGKMVLGGSLNGVWSNVYRITTNGVFDTSFATTGKVHNQAGPNWYQLALQQDGKIIHVGTDTVEGYVQRWHTNGTVDTSFSTTGTRKLISGTYDEIYSVIVLDNRKVMAAGAQDDDFILLRLTTNGAFDTSFSNDGVIKFHVGAADEVNDIIELPNGKVCGAGESGADAVAFCIFP